MKIRPSKTYKQNYNANLVYFKDDLIKSLIFKYLRMYYPIDRVKINGKFKRAIIVDNKVYSISSDKNSFLSEIILKISNSFNISENDSKSIIFDFFKLK